MASVHPQLWELLLFGLLYRVVGGFTEIKCITSFESLENVNVEDLWDKAYLFQLTFGIQNSLGVGL